jgi:Ca-activated chloride channel family protein
MASLLRKLPPVGVVLWFVAFAGAQTPSRNYDFSLDVNRVVLPVSVTDKRGDSVSGLTEGQFQVTENGRPQQILYFEHEDIPVTVGLILDNSGSMRPKRNEVVAAGLSFAHSSNPQDELFVVNFNENVSLGLPPTVLFTNDFGPLVAAMNGVPASGRTALYDAINVAFKHLKMGTRDKKALIVVSDGGDNSSSHGFRQVLLEAEKSDAIIYTIGVYDEDDPDRNPGVLKKLSKATGGESFFPQKLSEVTNICQRIAQDIRSQYTLAYRPDTPATARGFRTIRVTVSAPGHGKLKVRTRAGYYPHSAGEDSHALLDKARMTPGR